MRRLSTIEIDTDPASAARPRPRKKRNKRIAFGWYGGKFSHLGWLLPLLPDCHHYCEPFAGSGAVLLNRRPAPLETYNDLDGDVVNFFRVLRDKPDQLISKLQLTPFSREEFFYSIHDKDSSDPVESARLFFVRARQVRTGLAQTASLGRWANCKTASRAGMAGVVSRWLGGVAGLQEIAERLLRVQFENRPALDVIEKYDHPGTLFYCDPPYIHSSRGDKAAYRYEMSDREHVALAKRLSGIEGKAAISGYRSPLQDELFADWYRFDAPVKSAHSIKADRQECLWMNYHPGILAG